MEKTEKNQVSKQHRQVCESVIEQNEPSVQNEKHPEKKPKTRGKVAASYLAKVGLFSALAFVLRLLKFPMPFAFPIWLELHFADFPALICGFALGPVAGCTVTVVSTLLKILTAGTGTGYVGDLANILAGIALVLPSALIYKFHKNKKGAILGVIVGSICSTIVSIPANRYVLVPFYAGIYGFDTVVGMFAALFKNVTEDTFYTLYIFGSVIPFNILRCVVVGGVTFLVYKKISHLLSRF